MFFCCSEAFDDISPIGNDGNVARYISTGRVNAIYAWAIHNIGADPHGGAEDRTDSGDLATDFRYELFKAKFQRDATFTRAVAHFPVHVFLWMCDTPSTSAVVFLRIRLPVFLTPCGYIFPPLLPAIGTCGMVMVSSALIATRTANGANPPIGTPSPNREFGIHCVAFRARLPLRVPIQIVLGQFQRHAAPHPLQGALGDFRGGSPGIEEMERCTLESKRVICVFSPEYVLSEWTKFENIMAQALDPGAVSRKVVPVLYKDCDIPLRLRILHYRDMRIDAPEAWALLARDLM